MAALSWLADCESSSLPSDASSLHGCEHCWHTKLTLRGQFPGVGVRFAGCRGGGSAGGSNREAPRSCESNVTNMRRDHRPENSVGRSHEKCTGARGGGGAQTCVLQRAFLRCLRVSGGAETPRGRCARWEGLPFRVEPGLTPDPILGGRERGRRREKGGGDYRLTSMHPIKHASPLVAYAKCRSGWSRLGTRKCATETGRN